MIIDFICVVVIFVFFSFVILIKEEEKKYMLKVLEIDFQESHQGWKNTTKVNEH